MFVSGIYNRGVRVGVVSSFGYYWRDGPVWEGTDEIYRRGTGRAHEPWDLLRGHETNPRVTRPTRGEHEAYQGVMRAANHETYPWVMRPARGS